MKTNYRNIPDKCCKNCKFRLKDTPFDYCNQDTTWKSNWNTVAFILNNDNSEWEKTHNIPNLLGICDDYEKMV